MPAEAAFSVTLTGVEQIAQRFLRLQDFKALVRAPVQAALDEAASTQRAGIKRGKTGKAQASIGTHIHTISWGVYGNAGPRGTSRFREGFITALFLNTGTGTHLRNAFSAGGGKAGQQAPGGYSIEGGKRQRIHKTRAPGLIYPETKTAMSFPAYGSTSGLGSLFGARFGAKAKSTTSRGRYKQARFGGLGKVFARSTAGMRAQPWGRAAAQSSRGRSMSAFAEALHKNIAETSRG